MDIQSQGSAGPAGGGEAVPGPGAGGSPVSHDMEAIFGQAEALPRTAASDRSGKVVPMAARKSGGKAVRAGTARRLALPAIVAAGALALAVALAPQHRPEIATRQVARPVPAAAWPTRETRRDFAAAEPAPRVAADPSRKAAARSAARAASRHESGSCGRRGGIALARCMRPQILVADRALRSAYRHAIRRGVDRDVLVAYRERWSSLRRRAISDPRRVVAGYRQMAEGLAAVRSGGGRSG